MSQNYKHMSRAEDKHEADDDAPEVEHWCWKLFRCICCPIILIWHSIRIYCCGCILSKCEDCIHFFQMCCCSCFSTLFCGGCGLCSKQWRDDAFGPAASAKSLGRPAANISWHPYEELLLAQGQKDGNVFIADGICGTDAAGQGDLGDCYLISAIMAIAEHPGLVYKCMKTRTHNPRGVYKFTFFNDNPGEHAFEEVEVDNLLPTTDGKNTVFAEMKGEGWFALLEKAMAKWVGSYEALDGGSTAWALTALTGGTTRVYQRENDGSWKQWESKWRGSRSEMRKSNLSRTSKSPIFKPAEMWQHLLDHTERRSVMCCSVSEGTSDRESVMGLAMRHAYSLVRAVECEGHKLLEIRNPWGASGKTADGQSRGEYHGDWGDTSPLWQQYPAVKKKLLGGGQQQQHEADGKFYMAFADFCKYFGSVSICSRATGFGDLVLVVDDSATCGTCVGCVGGCCSFWCCCEGVKALCCAHGAEETTQ